MFTGIIEAVGTLRKLERKGDDIRLTVASGKLDLSDVRLGDSIATNGVCLTVVQQLADGYVADFVAGISKLNMIFAHSVMQPVGEFESAYGSVPGDAKVAHPEMDLSDLMNLAVDGHGIVTVADAGNTVGVINRARLLRAIQNSQA